MSDFRPEVLGARSVGDTSCLQELKLVKDEEQFNDEMRDNEEDESKSSHSEKSGGGSKLVVVLPLMRTRQAVSRPALLCPLMSF